jgi:tetratricopeptide (TPR) repeat protein
MKKLVLALCMFCIAPLAFATQQLDEAILGLRQAWDQANYALQGGQKEKALEAVAARADALVQHWPGRAEPLVWKGIALASWAGAKGGLGALGLAKQARDALLAAERVDPQVFNGSIYTTLGSLYYKVPGWPLGFGDDDKAREYFKKALAMNPDGLDPNYFYGDFLIDQGDYKGAAQVLQHALQAPLRKDRPVADRGRRAQAELALHKALQHVGSNG